MAGIPCSLKRRLNLMILQPRNVHHPRTFGAMPYFGGYGSYRPTRLSRNSHLGPYAVSAR